jgi:iron complex transport system substrate-binding protein
MKKVLLLCFFTVLLFSLSFSAVFIDDLGRQVSFDTTPKRIVVAAPALTDYVVRLGLSDAIVGVTDWDLFPAEKIGQLTPLNVEKIIALQPDVVLIAGGFQASEITRLEPFGVKALVLNPNSFYDIQRISRYLGTLFGVPEKGNKLALWVEDNINKIAIDKVYKIPLDKRKKVFYAMVQSSEIKDLWTCVQGSFLNEVLALAGGINITGSFAGPNGWLPISIEYVALQNPDVILVPYYYEGGAKEAIEAVLDFNPWQSITAVKKKAVVGIDGNKASYANPELVELLVEIYQRLYE